MALASETGVAERGGRRCSEGRHQTYRGPSRYSLVACGCRARARWWSTGSTSSRRYTSLDRGALQRAGPRLGDSARHTRRAIRNVSIGSGAQTSGRDGYEALRQYSRRDLTFASSPTSTRHGLRRGTRRPRPGATLSSSPRRRYDARDADQRPHGARMARRRSSDEARSESTRRRLGRRR